MPDTIWSQIPRCIERASVKASRSIVASFATPSRRPDLLRLGSNNGGWWVPSSVLNADSICYLAGVGEDATFDLALCERFGCEVWAIDPTPRAIAYADRIAEERFHFLPFGLWSQSASLKFYEPADPSHVSHSITNEQHTNNGFTAECLSVQALMEKLGHDRLDLLKLDIEGAEVAVLESVLATSIRPRVLCVEFDAKEVPWLTIRRLRLLREAGYSLCHRELRNYTFILE